MTRLRLATAALGLAVIAGGWLAFVVPSGSGDARTRPSRTKPRQTEVSRAKLSLPKLHGQATWRRRKRPAPAFALRDHNGVRISLASLRKRPVLLTFLDSECQ